jgi:uncharacterized repeat protein (TIGR03803 family)
VLYTFTGGTDGATPSASPVQDEEGNLYGTTGYGGDLNACLSYYFGTGCGTVFKADPEGKYTVLYSFTGGADGAVPYAGVTRDKKGNLYGTTVYGGDLSCGSGAGCGVVFKLDPAGKETVLYTFTGGADGATPYGGLVQDQEGNLYGTTFYGGDLSCGSRGGCGVVFKLDPGGKYTVLYSFTGGADGGLPYAGVIQDKKGDLYGTASGGGISNAGVVFKVDPTSKETVLYTFSGGADGSSPLASLVRDQDGNLYGTASRGGISNAGVVFKVDPTGKETVLHAFIGVADGATPYGGLVQDQKGNLYGTTFIGGGGGGYRCSVDGCGVVFKLDPAGKETVLYTFTGGADGGLPHAGVIQDKKGNLYGTTSYGGDLDSLQGWCSFGNFDGCGVVFKLAACPTVLCQGH